MSKRIDLVGRKFGRWTVTAFSHVQKKNPMWHCRCECGNEKIVHGGNLSSGSSTSCGCWHAEVNTRVHTTHKMTKHPIYRSWSSMKNRCLNPNSEDYKWYGGRGIKVCSRWMTFENFYSDMIGEWKPGLTIERMDVNGNYEPSNCTWITQSEQLKNTTRSIILDTPWGRMTAKEAAERIGIDATVFMARLRRNWPPDQLYSSQRFNRWNRQPHEETLR